MYFKKWEVFLRKKCFYVSSVIRTCYKDHLIQKGGYFLIVRLQFDCHFSCIDLHVATVRRAANNGEPGGGIAVKAYLHDPVAPNSTVDFFDRTVHEEYTTFDNPDRRAAVRQFAQNVARYQNRLAHPAQFF